jgi:hypothetical protein
MASMDAEMERPEKKEFKGNPFQRVLKDRGRYLAAVLTIVRGYLANNERTEVSPLGSFEDYTRFTRAPLIWLGQTDPADTMEMLHAADPALALLRSVMAAWEEAIGLGVAKTASEALDMAHNPSREFEDTPDKETPIAKKAREERDKSHVAACVALGEAFAAIGKNGAKITPQELGHWLRHHAGGISEGRRFMGEMSKRKSMAWSLTMPF